MMLMQYRCNNIILSLRCQTINTRKEMEQLLLSNEVFASEDEQPRQSVFDEVGMPSPKVYVRYTRMMLKRQLRRCYLYR